jgi:hypothetical protein|tara:strand:+ start:2753 stop:3070 length:318 start_codon:yes stop_codon:yes gene_type:complete
MESGDLVHGRTNPTHKRRKHVKIDTSVDEEPTDVEATQRDVEVNSPVISTDETENTTLLNDNSNPPEQKNESVDSNVVDEDDMSKTLVLSGSLILLLLCVGKVLG